MFHRGCILNACNAGQVDTSAQMGFNEYTNIREQARRNNCPLCQLPLIIDCNDFNNITLAPKIPDEELPLKIKGGKTRSNRRKISKQISKKRTSKKQISKKQISKKQISKKQNKNCKNTAKSKRKYRNITKRNHAA